MEKKTYNKREIFQKINDFEEGMHMLAKYNNQMHLDILSLQKTINNLMEENKELRKDIDMLTKITEGNLGDAPACEFFMLKTYRKDPIIYKDGKLISSDNMENVYVRWSPFDKIDVEVDN